MECQITAKEGAGVADPSVCVFVRGLVGSLADLGMGQNETTRIWTAGFSPWFHLPAFWVPIVDPQPFDCISPSECPVGRVFGVGGGGGCIINPW